MNLKRMWTWLCIVAAASPLYLVRFSVRSIPFTVFETLILLLAAFVFVRAILVSSVRAAYVQKIVCTPKIFFVGLGVFLLSGALSVIIAPHLLPALGIFRAYFIEALLLGTIAFLEFRDEHDLYELAAFVSVPVFIVSVYAIFQMITGYGIPNPYWAALHTRRATSVFGYPNATGLYVEFLIPFLIAAGYTTSGVKRSWFWAVGALAVIAFLCGKSSGATAAVFGTALLWLIAYKRTRKITGAIIGMSALIIALTPLRTPFAQQFLLQGFSGGIRIEMWKETVQMLKERPFFGAGLAGYQQLVAPFHQNKRVEIYLYPHNLWLTLWSECGLLGFLSFAFVFVYTAVYIFNSPKTVWRIALFSCFIIWLIHGIVDIPYFKNDFAAWYWIIVAIGMQLRYTKIS